MPLYHEPVIVQITQQMVEDVIRNYGRPVTCTEITKQLTGRKLVLAVEDNKVKRHLKQLLDYNILVVTGFNADKEYYYTHRFRVKKAEIHLGGDPD